MMETSELQGLVHSALEGAGDACGTLTGYLSESARLFRKGDSAQGSQLLSGFLEDFSQLFNLLHDVSKTDTCYGTRAQGLRDRIHDHRNTMMEIFKSIFEAQNNKDWVFLADIIEYDLLDAMNEWKDVFMAISRRA